MSRYFYVCESLARTLPFYRRTYDIADEGYYADIPSLFKSLLVW